MSNVYFPDAEIGLENLEPGLSRKIKAHGGGLMAEPGRCSLCGRQLDQAVTAHNLMDWTVNSRMYNDLTREVELLSQYLWTYGWAGVHVTWQQEMGQKEQYLTMDQVMALAAQSPEGSILADLPNLIANPEADDQSAELLLAAFPNLRKRRALKAIRELRTEGECDFPIPTMVSNKPMVAALAPYDELVFPPETTDIQSARVVFRRYYMTEAQLLNKVETEEWDAEWAQEAINTMGRFSDYSAYTYAAVGLAENSILDRENLIEVVYAYQKSIDSDGIPGVFYTVFSPQVGDKWGYFDLLDYTHGQYPFVIWRSELIHRQITESRGVPEVCSTWQHEVKAQRDSIFDYTSLATLPPIEVPKTRGGNLKIGPAIQIPVLRRGEIGFLAPPAREPGVAFQLIAAIEAQTDRYFGRPTEKVPPVITQMRQQRLINNWLHGWTEIDRASSIHQDGGRRLLHADFRTDGGAGKTDVVGSFVAVVIHDMQGSGAWTKGARSEGHIKIEGGSGSEGGEERDGVGNELSRVHAINDTTIHGERCRAQVPKREGSCDGDAYRLCHTEIDGASICHGDGAR